MFDPLDFLAEVTQHIPNRCEHQLRYYGWYSNKMRGQPVGRSLGDDRRAKREVVEKSQEEKIVRKNAPSWDMLIKCIFEVYPLKWQTTGSCECRRSHDDGKAA